jgi:hypothetical protein
MVFTERTSIVKSILFGPIGNLPLQQILQSSFQPEALEQAANTFLASGMVSARGIPNLDGVNCNIASAVLFICYQPDFKYLLTKAVETIRSPIVNVHPSRPVKLVLYIVSQFIVDMLGPDTDCHSTDDPFFHAKFFVYGISLFAENALFPQSICETADDMVQCIDCRWSHRTAYDGDPIQGDIQDLTHFLTSTITSLAVELGGTRPSLGYVAYFDNNGSVINSLSKDEDLQWVMYDPNNGSLGDLPHFRQNTIIHDELSERYWYPLAKERLQHSGAYWTYVWPSLPDTIFVMCNHLTYEDTKSGSKRRRKLTTTKYAPSTIKTNICFERSNEHVNKQCEFELQVSVRHKGRAIESGHYASLIHSDGKIVVHDDDIVDTQSIQQGFVLERANYELEQAPTIECDTDTNEGEKQNEAKASQKKKGKSKKKKKKPVYKFSIIPSQIDKLLVYKRIKNGL